MPRSPILQFDEAIWRAALDAAPEKAEGLYARVRHIKLEFQQLAYTMLVQGLRLHLAEGLRGRIGWLFALSDKQMNGAITSIHDEPAHDWTVEELGQRAGMSRSTFALRFKETVGVSPMEYLTR
jgi:hypothetical protein